MKELILKYRILLFIPAIIFMGVIFSFSNETGSQSSSVSLTVTTSIVDTVDVVVYNDDMDKSLYDRMVDFLHTPIRKSAHICEYMLLSLLVFGPLFAFPVCRKKMHFIIPIIWCFLYACTDEFHQTFINARSGQFSDVCIDLSGVCVLMSLLYLIFKCKKLLKQ